MAVRIWRRGNWHSAELVAKVLQIFRTFVAVVGLGFGFVVQVFVTLVALVALVALINVVRVIFGVARLLGEKPYSTGVHVVELSIVQVLRIVVETSADWVVFLIGVYIPHPAGVLLLEILIGHVFGIRIKVSTVLLGLASFA